MNWSTLPLLLLAGGLSAQTPTNIEAAEWNPWTGEWLVSNGSSVLSTPDGSSWAYFGEAIGSHGMEVSSNLFVTASGSTIRAYDATTAEFLGSANVPGAQFLNGMGADGVTFYVSDFSGSRIHAIDATDPAAMLVSTLVPSTPCTPNGVTYDASNDRILFVCWGASAGIHAVDPETGEVSTVVANTGLGNLDGIDGDGAGNYYVSSWSPARITRFSDDFAASETVVSSGLASPADISFDPVSDILGVANSGNQTLTLHDFSDFVGLPSVAGSKDCGEFVWSRADGILSFSDAFTGAWELRAYAGDGRLVIESQVATLPIAVPASASVLVLTSTDGCRQVLR